MFIYDTTYEGVNEANLSFSEDRGENYRNFRQTSAVFPSQSKCSPPDVNANARTTYFLITKVNNSERVRVSTRTKWQELSPGKRNVGTVPASRPFSPSSPSFHAKKLVSRVNCPFVDRWLNVNLWNSSPKFRNCRAVAKWQERCLVFPYCILIDKGIYFRNFPSTNCIIYNRFGWKIPFQNDFLRIPLP